MRWLVTGACLFATALLLRVSVSAQGDDLLFDALTHPAIAYRTTPPHDRVAELLRSLQAGDARLTFASDGSGYLRSVLDALHVPVESQMAVFSQTSLQSPIITPRNPRTIFFTDDVAVAWPRGGFIELAALDPRQGMQFYMLRQQDAPTPELIRPESLRQGACLGCHHALSTRDVPGMLVLSVAAGADGRTLPYVANFITDDRSPIEQRWAGWYVTGKTGAAKHLGNLDALTAREGAATISPHSTSVDSLGNLIDLRSYLTPYSDIAALLVFDHQAHAVNTLTRAGWEVRVAEADRRADASAIVTRAAQDLVDVLLFVDEARLPGGIESGSGFVRVFEARGPSDRKGRSLRQLDLRTRLMRYPCSYMIYSAAFDALPQSLKDATYRRLWTVLSGADTNRRYARLTTDDRRAIAEILRQTKPDLPSYFQ